jgi:hypothetical protein
MDVGDVAALSYGSRRAAINRNDLRMTTAGLSPAAPAPLPALPPPPGPEPELELSPQPKSPSAILAHLENRARSFPRLEWGLRREAVGAGSCEDPAAKDRNGSGRPPPASFSREPSPRQGLT